MVGGGRDFKNPLDRIIYLLLRPKCAVNTGLLPIAWQAIILNQEHMALVFLLKQIKLCNRTNFPIQHESFTPIQYHRRSLCMMGTNDRYHL